MDERQRQITEGAGLEESRINKDFVDFLQKWSTPVLLLILIIAGAYAGSQYLERQRIERLDEAFLAYDAAELEGRPEPLLEVAREYSGVGAIEELALLAAADLLYTSYYTRRPPGAIALPDAQPLSEDEAGEMLDRAGELYAEALGEVEGVRGRALLEVGALWGLTSVQLSRGDFDAAEPRLRRVLELTQEHGYANLAERAEDLLGRLPALREQRAPVVVEPQAPAEAPAETAPEGESESAPGRGDATETPAEDDGGE